MKNKDFKNLHSTMKTFEKIEQPTSGKLVGVIVNGNKYNRKNLTRTQLASFEHMPDFPGVT